MNIPDYPKRLDSILRTLDSRRRKHLLIIGTLGTGAVILLSLSVVSALSLLSESPAFYSVLKFLFLAATTVGIIKYLTIPLYRKEDQLHTLSIELDKVSHGLGEQTVNAAQLQSGSLNTANTGTSKELAYAHIEKVVRRLESIDLKALFRIRSTNKQVLRLGGAAVLCAVILFFTPGGFLGFLFSAHLLHGTPTNYLELADIEITLQAPEYSGLLDEVISNSSGDIKGLKGTKVHFRAKPLSKVSSASLVIGNGPSLPTKVQSGEISAEFNILGNGSYVIREPGKNISSKPFSIALIEDKVPEISISNPGGDNLELNSDESVDIYYEAADDFGITKIKLKWDMGNGPSERVIYDRNKNPNPVVNGKYTFDLRSVDLSGGSNLNIIAETYDTDTVSGPKAGISNPITIKIKDARNKHNDTLNLAEQLMEELIQLLGDEIEIAAKIKPPSFEDNSDGESADRHTPEQILDMQHKLTRSITHALDTLVQTIDSFKEDNFSDYTYFVGLSNMDVRIRGLLELREMLIENFAIVDLPRLGRLMTKEITEFEDDILFLDSILKGEKLKESLNASRELLGEIAELSELLNKLNETGDKTLHAEIQKRLDEINKLLSELAQKMADMSTEMQEGFLNADAFQSQNMQHLLQEIMKLAEQGNIEDALKNLTNLASNLQNMMASLQNGMQSFGTSMLSGEMSKLNELIARIDALEKEETALRDRTQILKDSMLDNPAASKSNLRDFIDQEKEKVAELKKNLQVAKTKASKQSGEIKRTEGLYMLDQMLNKAAELSNWIEAMQLEQAYKTAGRIEEGTQGLGQMSKMEVGNLGRAHNELQQSEQLAREIRKDLESPAKTSSGSDESTQIASRQDEVKSDTGELGTEVDQMKDNSLLDPKIGEKIGEAGISMDKASQGLNEEQISKAISNQGNAIKSLQEAKNQAQQMLEQMQMSASGGGSPVPMVLGQQQQRQGQQGIDTRYVEIPRTAESEVGKEFKEQILEAMKSGSPEGYIELNKKYYDRIIK